MKLKLNAELVVIIPLVILWAILGIICFFWDLDSGDLHLGHMIVHLGFYVGTVVGVGGLFFLLIEYAKEIADWWNERESS